MALSVSGWHRHVKAIRAGDSIACSVSLEKRASRWQTRWTSTSSAREGVASSSTSSSQPYVYSLRPTRRDDRTRLLSRVSGPTDLPLSHDTLAQFWQDRVNRFGKRTALIVRHEPSDQHASANRRSERDRQLDGEDCIRWTFEEMNDHVCRLVEGMRRIGIRRGDRVAVLMMNNSAMASLQVATAFLGAILVTLNPSYTAKQLLHALNHVGAAYLFIVPSLRTSDYLRNLCSILPSLTSSAATNGDKTLIDDQECPTLRRIVLLDNLSRRPGPRWSSESILGNKAGFTFDEAIQNLNERAIDYRDLLVDQSSAGKDAIGEQDGNVHFKDVVNLQLTSGTTGAPKAVGLSSYNLVNNGIMLGDVMRLDENDILANIPPLFHCFGLTLGNLAAWSRGACVLYPSEGFNPLRTLRAASEERATAIHGVPAHFIAELDVLRQVRAAQEQGQEGGELERLGVGKDEKWQYRLRTGFTSGSTVPIELMRAIMDPDLLGAKEQTVVYGMTETSPVSFACPTSAPVELRCKTVGQVIPHVHAKICSADDPEGKPLPVNEVGELCTGGYIVMDGGYWQDEARTKEVLQRHGSTSRGEEEESQILWMRTGDLAVMNEDGYVEIRGRVKDMIIRGGENLTATGIENCIDTLPGVASCAVVAVPDEKLGETVGVFISRVTAARSNDDINDDKPEPGSGVSKSRQLVRQYVKEHLSGQCAPDWVWFLGEKEGPIDEQMPSTASGKVQKVVLREWAKQLAQKGFGRAKKDHK